MKEIQLTQGKVTVVDDKDFEWLSQWKWCAHLHPQSGKYYVVRSKTTKGKKKTVRMSREILEITETNIYVDHINGDTLDNRRDNLRSATNTQNQWNSGLSTSNTKGLKGISYSPTRTSFKKWQAKIRFGGKRLHIGYFETPEEAASAYLRKARELHGEFFRDPYVNV